jgi:hypothetical protein
VSSRRRGRKNNAKVIALGVLILFASLGSIIDFLRENIIVVVVIAAIAIYIGVLCLVVRMARRKKKTHEIKQTSAQNQTEKIRVQPRVEYTPKKSIMTNCEKAYYKAIKEIIGSEYILQPQINLASVIEKTSNERYQNELFRNVDFGVFDHDFRLIVLIEINDQTHIQMDRKIRDAKVHSICEEAGIPLVTFWTQYGVNVQYMKERLSQYLMINNISSNENAPATAHTSTTAEEKNKNDDRSADSVTEQSGLDMDVQLDFTSIMQEHSSESVDL